MGASGVGNGGNAGVCIGSTVIRVVRWCWDIRRWAALSIEALLIMVLLVLELVSCLWVRQAVASIMIVASDTIRGMFVFFMVYTVYCKGNTFESNVQWIYFG